MVGLRKLSSTNAFVVTDLVDVPSFGIVRCAKKILQGGAKDLARSMTYTFASFEMQRGGASGGINALYLMRKRKLLRILFLSLQMVLRLEV